MLRRLSALTLALLALLPTAWAVSAAGCGVDEPCCCGTPEAGPDAQLLVPDDCCCEIRPASDVPEMPQAPRDLPAGDNLAPPALAPAAAAAAPPPRSAEGARPCRSGRPRASPAALYLRHHAFLC
jgi:hypothetical protein